MPTNRFGQPVGDPVPDWSPRPDPVMDGLVGHAVTLEVLAPRHVDDLFTATCGLESASRWTYLFYEFGPDDHDAFATMLADKGATPGVHPFAIVPHSSGRPEGFAAMQRTDTANGCVELGSIMLAPSLAGTRAATEMVYLVARHVFDDLGYRRLEWKCDSHHSHSRRAAARFGFTYEGTFRHHMVIKGASRDTAWFAIADDDWERLRPVYERWLDDANFDASGAQRSSLRAMTAEANRSSTA